MEELKEEGIVLRSFDFKENDRIITVYAENSGIISLIVKGINGKNKQKAAHCRVFSKIEYVYQKGKSDLFKYIDGTTLDAHSFLRENLEALQTAGEIVRAILQTQLPEKPSPLLYRLLRSYLKQLEHCTNYPLLLLSFQIKLLKHEGSVSLLFEGASPAEQEVIFALDSLRAFEELDQFKIEQEMIKKIEKKMDLFCQKDFFC